MNVSAASQKPKGNKNDTIHIRRSVSDAILQYERGILLTRTGKKVTSRVQAIAIGLSNARQNNASAAS